MALSSALKLRTIIDSVPTTSLALGHAPQEEISWTEKERANNAFQRIPDSSVDDRLPKDSKTKEAVLKLSKTHSFAGNIGLQVLKSGTAESDTYTVTYKEDAGSPPFADFLDDWHEKAEYLDPTSTERKGKELPLTILDVSSSVPRRFEQLWKEHFFPASVRVELSKVIVLGGPGQVRSDVEPPAGCVGLIHVAFGVNRKVLLTHFYRGSSKTHRLSTAGQWGASVAPGSIHLMTVDAKRNPSRNECAAIAFFAAYTTNDSLQDTKTLLLDIPRPFGLLLQFDEHHSGDPRSQLVRQAAQEVFGDSLLHCPVIVKVKRYVGYDKDAPKASSSVFKADDSSMQQVASRLNIDINLASSSPHRTGHGFTSLGETGDLPFYSAQPMRGMKWTEDQEIIPAKELLHGSKTGVYFHSALIVQCSKKCKKMHEVSSSIVTRSQTTHSEK